MVRFRHASVFIAEARYGKKAHTAAARGIQEEKVMVVECPWASVTTVQRSLPAKETNVGPEGRSEIERESEQASRQASKTSGMDGGSQE